VELLSIEEDKDNDEVLEMMKMKGYRPATIHETLIWAKDNWKNENVVALGSVFTAGGFRYVLFLWRGGSRRELGWRWLSPRGRWGRGCLFAGVREVETKNLDPKEVTLPNTLNKTRLK
jgi:hypothetical protein